MIALAVVGCNAGSDGTPASYPERPCKISRSVAFRRAFQDTPRMRRAAVVGLAFGVVMLASQAARAQMIRLGEVLVLTPSDGMPAQVGDDQVVQADRGNRKGQFYRVRTGAVKTHTTPATDRSTESLLMNRTRPRVKQIASAFLADFGVGCGARQTCRFSSESCLRSFRLKRPS